MKTLFRIILALLAFAPADQAADLVSSGDWTETITASNLVSGAGSNLQSQLQSMAGVTSLTISNAPGSWTLRVHRTGSPWAGEVALFVKRTSAGSGSGSIAGGESFVEVTASDVEIFNGSEARSNVALQFKLTGLSVGVSPANYLSSIVFTVQ